MIPKSNPKQIPIKNPYLSVNKNNQNNTSENNAPFQPTPVQQPKPERIEEGKTSGMPTPVKK